jgi:hypothetical protein
MSDERNDRPMKVTALKIKNRHFSNWHSEVENRWDYDDLKADPTWCQDWISFDSCLFVAEQNRLYIGLTSIEGDIFWFFDRASRSFVSCGYKKLNHPFDAKFHRSLLQREKDGCLYAATALLHDIDRFWEAPGGAIVRYDPASGTLQQVAVPLPHIYIQGICLDQNSDVIYGIGAVPERMFSHDLKTGVSRDLGPISSGMEFVQGQNAELDDEGCTWSAWSITRAWQNSPGPDSKRLCKYDPKRERIIYFKTGLPKPGSANEYVRLDGLFNLGTGDLFASGGNGSLYRIETSSGKATWLGTPITDRASRLSSMKLGPDGCAYGVTGMEGRCEVIRFNPKTYKYELLGPVSSGEDQCWQVHDIAVTPDGTIYACENDNPRRSSFLWEIIL